MKAIFLDRDGTIIVDPGYLSDPSKVRYFPWTFSAMKMMMDKGFNLFMVTNQSGIGRGLYTLDDMKRVNARVVNDLKDNGISFTDIAYCPHAPELDCECRKPNPKMILDLISKYNIDPKSSYMIGDKEADAVAGERSNVTGVLLSKTHHAKFKTFPSILEFAISL